VNRTQNKTACACHRIAVIVADETAADDFRLRSELAGVLVDCNDRDDDAVLGEMFAFADDNFLDFFQRTGIDENATGGDRFAAEGAIFVEFDAMAVLEEKDFAGDSTDLMRERSVAEEMAKFAVHGNEIFWLYQLQQKLLFLLSGV